MRKDSWVLLSLSLFLMAAIFNIRADLAAANTGELISRDEAVRIVQNLFPALSETGEWQADIQPHPYDKGQCWQISSSQPEMTARLDAVTGCILDFRYDPGDYYPARETALTREEAFTRASSFLPRLPGIELKKLQYDQRGGLIYSGFDGHQQRGLFWQRVENGLKVETNGVGISVDQITGEVSAISCVWFNQVLPPVRDIMTTEQMQHSLLEEMGLNLVYSQPFWDDNWKTGGSRTGPEAVPVYKLNTEAIAFDARHGNGIDIRGKLYPGRESSLYAVNPVPTGNAAVKEELRPKTKMEPAVLERAARDFFQSQGRPGEIIHSGGGGSGGDGFQDEYWSYTLKDGKQDPSKGEVNIDLYTGEITGFRYPSQAASGEKTEVSYAQALQTALDTVKNTTGISAAQLLLCSHDSGENLEDSYSFKFHRLINGIPLEIDNVTVLVEKSSGQAVQYSRSWHPARCASLQGIISRQEALELFKSRQLSQLVYLFPRDENYNLMTPLVAYRLQYPLILDARSGRFIEIGNLEPEDNAGAASHWAAEAIAALQDSHLAPAGVEPDAALNRLEALKVVMGIYSHRSYGPMYWQEQPVRLQFTDVKEGHPATNILQQAAAQGVLVNRGSFRAEEMLTREELAVWLINSLGYREIARMPARIELVCADAGAISPESFNSMALASGLGLLTAGEDGKIRPRDPVSWGEMAVVAFRLAPLIKDGPE